MKVAKYALELYWWVVGTKRKKCKLLFFLQNHKKTEMEAFAFCVITFEPINI
jgi:hypothetical protein